ncbi:MAG: efflux RND transporter periplasmic adaptor subunit [Bacteroidales bacterium]|nr:efflux RND transporter periplasmic adaptor subunit [Bacteroidales bacterium]
MKKTVYYLMSALLLVSCSKNSKNYESSLKPEQLKLETQKVKTAANKLVLKYSGTIEAWKSIPVSFQTNGTVAQIYADEGQYVKKNQLLASLDKSDAQNSYQIAKAKEEQAQDAYKRLKTVHDQGSLPEIKWVEILTNLKQAQSMAQISKSNLQKCELRAPVSGYIGKRNVEIGMSALRANVPFELVEIQKVYIKIPVPENEIGILKKDMNAQITVSALNNKEFTGTIKQIGIVANTFSRTYDVKILVNNPDLLLKPGMVCDVKIDAGKQKQKILIATKSVSVDDKGKTFVYLIKDNNTIVKQPVKTGAYANNKVEILEGLKQGDLIVVSGQQKINSYTIKKL